MKLLKHLRYLFWFIRIDSWQMWKHLARHGPRTQVFRNRRYPDGRRMYINYRWGIQIIGLQIGDRGGSREYMRKQLFGGAR